MHESNANITGVHVWNVKLFTAFFYQQWMVKNDQFNLQTGGVVVDKVDTLSDCGSHCSLFETHCGVVVLWQDILFICHSPPRYRIPVGSNSLNGVSTVDGSLTEPNFFWSALSTLRGDCALYKYLILSYGYDYYYHY